MLINTDNRYMKLLTERKMSYKNLYKDERACKWTLMSATTVTTTNNIFEKLF
jgi:hypothetical protein